MVKVSEFVEEQVPPSTKQSSRTRRVSGRVAVVELFKISLLVDERISD